MSALTVGSLFSGCLIFGRTESTRCYSGDLTYGSVADIASGRARYSRWEILNLARVWMIPNVQKGGAHYGPDYLPGYIDRNGDWRSTLASDAIKLALDRIVFDYLAARPPVWLGEPYQLREILSYCNTRLHRGTIYKAAGFRLVRVNASGIQTWAKPVRALTSDEDQYIEERSSQCERARRLRIQRAQASIQLAISLI